MALKRLKTCKNVGKLAGGLVFMASPDGAN
jgi:hypothetical protein